MPQHLPAQPRDGHGRLDDGGAQQARDLPGREVAGFGLALSGGSWAGARGGVCADPLVPQALGGGGAALGLRDEQPADEVLGGRGGRGAGREGKVGVEDGGEGGDLGGSLEGMVAAQHCEEQQAHRPQVDLAPVPAEGEGEGGG